MHLLIVTVSTVDNYLIHHARTIEKVNEIRQIAECILAESSARIIRHVINTMTKLTGKKSIYGYRSNVMI